MTWEQYWHEDPLMVLYYRKAERLRQERMDSAAWLQGAYVYDAVILHPFAKKWAKPIPYLEKPFGFKEEASQEDIQQKAESERLKAQLFFRNWARAAKKHFEE